jgi:hypothetical protein
MIRAEQSPSMIAHANNNRSQFQKAHPDINTDGDDAYFHPNENKDDENLATIQLVHQMHQFE